MSLLLPAPDRDVQLAGHSNQIGERVRRHLLHDPASMDLERDLADPELRAQYSSIIERDRYFEKPFDGQRLLAAIRTALEGARPKGAA